MHGDRSGPAAGLGSAGAAALVAAAADVGAWADHGGAGLGLALRQQAASTPERAAARADTVVAASSVGVGAACPAAPRRKSFAEVGACVGAFAASGPLPGTTGPERPMSMLDRYICERAPSLVGHCQSSGSATSARLFHLYD